MAIREILRMGHPLLRQRARALAPGEARTARIRNLVEDMVDTLHHAGGIGLAAPQVGESLRLAIIEIAGGPSRYGEIPSLPLTVFVNPEIEVLDERVAGCWEGCLSVPGLRGWVERPQSVRVRSLGLDEQAMELELRSFLATVFQHEFDHLDGRLYVDLVRDPKQLLFEDLLERHLEAAAAPGGARE